LLEWLVRHFSRCLDLHLHHEKPLEGGMIAFYACLMTCQWSVMIGDVLFFQFSDGAQGSFSPFEMLWGVLKIF